MAPARIAARTAGVSVRSGSTACAPDSASAAAVVPPVATATARAPVSSAAATSSGVSPTSTVAGPEKSVPYLRAALSLARCTSSARTSWDSP